MAQLPNRRVLWAGLATLAGILGLGNGVWNYVTGPVLIRTSQWLLRATSLGVGSYKDRVYAAAAHDFPERVATLLLLYILTAFVFFHVYFFFSMRDSIQSLRASHLGEPRKRSLIRRTIFGDPGATPDEAALTRLSRVLHLLFVVMVFLAGYIVTSSASLILTNAAVGYYRELRAIVAPHVDQPTLLRYDARFTRVRTRDQYYSLVKDMDTEARTHTADVPDFNVW